MKTETMEYQKPVWRLTVGESVAESFRRLVRGNYFYGLSAVLMLWAAYHLMYSPLFTGDKFIRTLKALLVLQGYEVLVIATAILIVRRLKALDDAFMLLLVEVALLLDPTFFSDHFGAEFYRHGRLIAPYGIWVNDACFLLAPFKLLILLHGLRLKLAKNGWLAFVFTAFGIYMAESLILRDPFWWEWSRDGYCYLLAWMPLVFAAILPPVRDLIQVSGGLVVVGDEGKGFITARRLRFLNHAFLWLPLAVLFAHFVESLCVHQVFFYPMHLAPIVLALGVLWVRNSPKNHIMARMLVLDALVSLAIVLSLPAANVPRPLRPGDPVEVRVFMFCNFPLAVCGALVIALYWYFYRKFQYRPALYRVMALACAGVGAGLLQIEAVREVIAMCWFGAGHAIEWTWVHFWGAVAKALRWIGRHPLSYLGVLWAGLVWLAWKYRNAFTFFIAGTGPVLAIFGSLPGPTTDWMPEILQSLFLLGIALDHGFSRSGKRQLRYCLAWAMMLTALARFLDEGALCTWGGVVVALESALFIAAGTLLRHPGYALVGALMGLALTHSVARFQGWYGQPALIILTAALGTFAAGVVITFNKQRILGWLGNSGGGSILPPPAPDTPFGPAARPPAIPRRPLWSQADGTAAPEQVSAGDKAEAATEPREKQQNGMLHVAVQGLPVHRPDMIPEASPAGGATAQRDAAGTPVWPVEVAPEEEAAAGMGAPGVAPDLDVKNLLQGLFLTDPDSGIYLYQDLPLAAFAEAEQRLMLEPGEQVAVSFVAGRLETASWNVLLTDRRLICRPSRAGAVLAFHYAQIARIRESEEGITLFGHAGQKTLLNSLNAAQAACLAKGLRILIFCGRRRAHGRNADEV